VEFYCTHLPQLCGLRLKCDGTRAETRFRLSAKRTSPFKSAGASVQSTTGSRGVRISGSNARYTMFRGSVKSTGYPLLPPVSPSLPPVRHRVSSHFNCTLPTSYLAHDCYIPVRLIFPDFTVLIKSGDGYKLQRLSFFQQPQAPFRFVPRFLVSPCSKTLSTLAPLLARQIGFHTHTKPLTYLLHGAESFLRS